jgi:subtilisin family serine protease
MKYFVLIIHISVIFILTLFAFSQTGRAAEYVPGEVLVKFKDHVNTSNMNNIHANINSVKKRGFKKIKIHHIKLPDNMNVKEAVKYYQQNPDVEYAEPNYIVYTTAPNPPDDLHNNLWGLNNTGQAFVVDGNNITGTDGADIDAPEAWDTETGTSNDIIIAVVDTGVDYNHPDLSGNIWTNTGEDIPDCDDGNDNDGNGYVDDCKGWDFVDNDNDPMDYHSHGTHVAGTIAAEGDNTEGITGVMLQAEIMPLRFLGVDGSGTTADAVSAILYANANGAHVINNSWGGSGFSQTLQNAIDASNAVVVCAAGNNGADSDSIPFYPASYTSSNIISAASTDYDDTIAPSSNFGDESVDLSAPGVSIYSTIPARADIFSDDFDDGDLLSPDWSTGGANDSWGVRSARLTDSAGNYIDDTDAWAQTPEFDLSGQDGCRLIYQMQLDTLSNDFLRVEASLNGSNWATLSSYSGTTGGFSEFIEDLTDYDGEATVYIRFRITTNGSGTADGASIDDVDITCSSSTYAGTEYTFFSGTSMAAPHVSGVSGLILAENSSLANNQVKAIILNNVDQIASVTDKVVTDGRLNADNAVQDAASSDAPTNLTAATISTSQINLSWTDNSSVESGFSIHRKTGSNKSFSEIAALSENEINYSDKGLSPGTKYYYKVQVTGASVGSFSFSNEDNATTASLPSGGGGGGGCFIATAAYGSIMHPYVKALRDFRDRYLLNSFAGKAFVRLYYKYSPPVADVIRNSEGLRFLARVLLTPLVLLVVFPYTSLFLFALISIAALFFFTRYKSRSEYC